MWEDIKDWFSEYWISLTAVISILAVVILLVISLIPYPFNDGYVMTKTYEEHKEWNTEEEERKYRTEYYSTSETYRDSDGFTHTRSVRKSRMVYDHTDIVSYHYIDDEDFILTVKSNDNKAGYNWWQRAFDKDRPVRDFKFYVEKNTYERLRIESKFVDKEFKYWRNDNITKEETARRRKGW
jgi:hypothetical protein